ncbi:2-hydroxyacyl-CoA dehydratase [Thermodesulfobacteriota bacterium]
MITISNPKVKPFSIYELVGLHGIFKRRASREYKCSGLVTFNLITCRPVVYPTVEMERILDEEFGIPSVPIECDLVDERTFSEAQTLARFDAFAERLLKMKPVFG